jgi:hypothetical protein
MFTHSYFLLAIFNYFYNKDLIVNPTDETWEGFDMEIDFGGGDDGDDGPPDGGGADDGPPDDGNGGLGSRGQTQSNKNRPKVR